MYGDLPQLVQTAAMLVNVDGADTGVTHGGKRVGVILSGGNVDLQLFAKLVLGAA